MGTSEKTFPQRKENHMRPVYDVNQTREYFDPEEKEPRTIFILGVLDAQEQKYLDSQFTTTEYGFSDELDEAGNKKVTTKMKSNQAEKSYEAVRLKLKGIKNFDHTLTFAEHVYPFGKRTVVSEQSMNAIKPFITELGTQILNDVTIDEKSTKNS